MRVLGILLAGGMGTRLKELTDSVPKPALNFGGKYRIIDFVLSNCSNSGIDNIGIITQYLPFELINYLGNGNAWDLDITNKGITVLPPYTSKQSGYHWQNGTAHAVFQYLNFMDLYEPELVLILSADHIYKMDYNQIIEYHMMNHADLTISTIMVNDVDCKRFGILEVNEHHVVTSFEEKPEMPKGNLASMGIYVFNYPVLKEILATFAYHDEVDFGKHIIPEMIQSNNVYAYPFDGYWVDIGTIDSLWKTNMDLLDHKEYLSLDDPNWPISSNNLQMPPHHVYPKAFVTHSYICEGSMILGNVFKSVISYSVLIGKNSTIMSCVIMPNVKVGENCYLKNVIIKMGVSIPDNTIIDNENNERIILVTEEYLREVTR